MIPSAGIGNSGMYGIRPSSICSGVGFMGRRGSKKALGNSNIPPEGINTEQTDRNTNYV
jgi:hypothetical protein